MSKEPILSVGRITVTRRASTLIRYVGNMMHYGHVED